MKYEVLLNVSKKEPKQELKCNFHNKNMCLRQLCGHKIIL